MNILALSPPRRSRERPPLGNKEHTRRRGHSGVQVAEDTGRLLDTIRILTFTETTTLSIYSIPKASCTNAHCHCRSSEDLYCASWPVNQENDEPALVSVTRSPHKPPASVSQSPTLQAKRKIACARQRAAPEQPSLDIILDANREGAINGRSLKAFVPFKIPYPPAKPLPTLLDGGENNVKVLGSASTELPASSSVIPSVEICPPPLCDNSGRLTNAAVGVQEAVLKGHLSTLGAINKSTLARLTPPDSQSPSPPKKDATLHQPVPSPSHNNGGLTTARGGSQPPPLPPEREPTNLIPSIESDTNTGKGEDSKKTNGLEQRFYVSTYKSPYTSDTTSNIERRVDQVFDDNSYDRAGAPPPPEQPVQTLITALLTAYRDYANELQGALLAPQPGSVSFTLQKPYCYHQPMHIGGPSEPYSCQLRLPEPFEGEEVPAPPEAPRPVQLVPLHLQWHWDEDYQRMLASLQPGHDEAEKSALELCLSESPAKLDKGKGRAPDPLENEETQTPSHLYAGPHRVLNSTEDEEEAMAQGPPPHQVLDSIEDDEEAIARGPPPSPRPGYRSLPRLLPKPAPDEEQVDDEEAIARGPPPSPRTGYKSLCKLSPEGALSQDQVKILVAFNSSPAAFGIPYDDDSDISDMSTDSDGTFELKNQKTHTVDRGKLLMETIRYHFQVPPDVYGTPTAYSSMSPESISEDTFYYEQAEVIPYIKRYSRAQNQTEEEARDNPPYLEKACSGTIASVMGDAKRVGYFADDHYFRWYNTKFNDKEVAKGNLIITEYHPCKSRYTVLHPRKYTAFERRLDEEKRKAAEGIKDEDGFTVPPPPSTLRIEHAERFRKKKERRTARRKQMRERARVTAKVVARICGRDGSPTLEPREESPAPGPRGWATKSQAREEAERLAKEGNFFQSPQDTPIPSIEDEVLDDNAVRASPYLPARRNSVLEFTREGLRELRLRQSVSEPPSGRHAFNIDALRAERGLPTRRYSLPNLPAPRSGLRLRSIHSRSSPVDAIPDAMFLPEWGDWHLKQYVERNKHLKVPKIVHTMAEDEGDYDEDEMDEDYEDEEEEEEKEDARRLFATEDDYEDQDCCDDYDCEGCDAEYCEEDVRDDSDEEDQPNPPEFSSSYESGNDAIAQWRSAVPASAGKLSESVGRKGTPSTPPGPSTPHTLPRKFSEPTRDIDALRTSQGLPPRQYRLRLNVSDRQRRRDLEFDPLPLDTPLPSAFVRPDNDSEVLRDHVIQQGDEEVPKVIVTLPTLLTPEREVREEGSWEDVVHSGELEDGELKEE